MQFPKKRNSLRKVVCIAWILGLNTLPASASETQTFTYDAKGRLVKVVRTGSVNNNVTAEYATDKADNRKNKKVTNSPNPPPP